MERNTSAALPSADALSAALDRHQLVVWYQPVVEVESGRVAGAEALIRWPQPDGSLLLPDSFLPQARRAGLLSRITHRVTALAFADLGEWLHQHPAMRLSINLEPEDFLNTDLLEHLNLRCRQYGVEPQQIALEMTENSAIDPQAIAPIVGQYRAAGHPIYLDDFGSGYANFSYLQALIFDALKIDRALVEPLPDRSLLPQIVALARSLSLEPLAEGVETRAQHHWLRAHGVKYAQGWLYGKALPGRAFIEESEKRYA